MSLMIKSAQVAPGVVRPGVAQGDPGLFGFLKKAGKVAIGGLTGGVGGAIGTAAREFGGGGERAIPRKPSVAAMGRSGTIVSGVNSFAPPPPPGGSVRITPRNFLPGGRPLVEVGGPGTAMVPASGMKLACPSGFHPNKSDYFLRDGTFVPKGSRCVKNRRKDPMNPRALGRAISRVEAGKKWQAKLREIETGRFTKAGNRKD